jgi:hypothetical protein
MNAKIHVVSRFTMNHDEKLRFKFKICMLCCASESPEESEEVLVRLDPVKFLVRLLELLELH